MIPQNVVSPQTFVPANPPATKNAALLDPFRIRQTSEPANVSYPASKMVDVCQNGAPFIAIKRSGKAYAVVQGCCDSWTCPKCGLIRAKREYGRMVHGCAELAQEHDLYFLTLTCRGRELSVKDSLVHYYEWTNRLLDALRTNASRNGKAWHYVQVTERQKRGHPHSHLLTTFCPPDLTGGKRLRSSWLEERVISAGLGNQYDISKVRNASAASRYVAKYLFKPSMFQTHWPKNWRRIRYSRSFPKLPEIIADAFPLIKRADWLKLARLALIVIPVDAVSLKRSQEMLFGHDVIVRVGSREAVSGCPEATG